MRESLRAGARKISRHRGSHGRYPWPFALERRWHRLARTPAWRYPHRARQQRVLFPNRHLHHYQHRAESDLFALPAVSGASGLIVFVPGLTESRPTKEKPVNRPSPKCPDRAAED